MNRADQLRGAGSYTFLSEDKKGLSFQDIIDAVVSPNKGPGLYVPMEISFSKTANTVIIASAGIIALGLLVNAASNFSKR